ncbi:hypothetical protein GALL_478380 [mine drainage metagenome]|uniref:Uncharacterized protein n=1 Tax=mine drainage metagenome TaxID=410659 RepID=A0A1J5PSH3_9ZZZZ
MNDIDGSAVKAGQPLGQLGAGRNFDLIGQARDDLAKGPDFVLAEPAGDQQVGGMPQRPGAALGRPTRDRLVEIPQE